MNDTSVARWSALGDMAGDIHTRDILAIRDRQERTRSRTRFTQSDGLHPMTAGWAIYNRNIYPVTDSSGKEHLITLKQHRVYLWALARIAADDCNTSMRAAARDLEVCVTTVANALRRFMAWGLLAFLSNRGKYGGLTLFARVRGDGLDRFARQAWEAIRAAWTRKIDRIRARSNVHSGTDTGARGYRSTYSSSSVDIKTERAEALMAALGCDPSRSSGRVACPAHGEHRNKTLSWKRAFDGGLIYHCFAGCTPAEIRMAAGQ